MKRKPSPDTPPKKSWRILAGELQTTDRSLRLWRGRPGAPKEPDAQLWRTYMAVEGLGRGRTGELNELRSQVEAERLKKLRRENAQAEGRLLSMDLLGPELTARSAGFAGILRFELERVLPPLLVGQPIAEIRAEMMRAVDRITERYNSKNYLNPDAIVAAVTEAQQHDTKD